MVPMEKPIPRESCPRITFSQAMDLYQKRRLLRPGSPCPPGPNGEAPGSYGQLRSRSEHQLLQRLCVRMPILRVFSSSRPSRSLCPVQGGAGGQNRGDPRVGGTQILLQGGHHPALSLSFYEEMLAFIKGRYSIHVHAFSPPEIVHFSKIEGIGVSEVLRRLRSAGLDSIPGGGAEILVDSVRKRVSPSKCSAKEWLDVMEEAHAQGLRTTATMMFGHEEQPRHRLEHLFALRHLQDRTGGFTAFIPWSFQPNNTAIDRFPETAVSYLRLPRHTGA